MPTAKQIKAAGGNDVGEWGEKDTRSSYDGPLNIGGEHVNPDKLVPFGDGEMGDLQSTGADGNFGDIYEQRLPVRLPRGVGPA